MPNINRVGSGHGRRTSPSGNRYWEYPNGNALKTVEAAFYILEHNVKSMRPCNDCFRKLPGGRTFAQVWADASVWVNYESRTTVGWYGAQHGGIPTEITVSQPAIARGRWWVAGTLVHELAHVNGAPSTTVDADATLLCCGLKNAYEGVIGMRQSGSSSEYA